MTPPNPPHGTVVERACIAFINQMEAEMRAAPELFGKMPDEAEGFYSEKVTDQQRDAVRRSMQAALQSPHTGLTDVERVARALAKADGKDPDAPAWVEGYGNRERTFGICWRDQYSAKAEAAIAALSNTSVPVTVSEGLFEALKALRGNISAASLVRNPFGQELRANADKAIADYLAMSADNREGR